ncbi:MAG: hypothetical protein Q9186_000656 [Xanthomendoza sp. 1 TL-2023]
MAYFIPSYFQKRILRYALSRLDFLDAEQLNLDNLDIAWGKQSVVELRDVGVQLKKLASLLNLPTQFVLLRASIKILRITVPADLYRGGIVAELRGVNVHLHATQDGLGDLQPGFQDHYAAPKTMRRSTDLPRSLQPKLHDPGGSFPPVNDGKDENSDSAALPTTDDLAKSFLQMEPKEEKDQLQAAVARSQHIDESQVSEDNAAVGVGMGLSLPAFLSGFLKGIGDRFRLSLRDIQVDISLQVDVPSEHSVTSAASDRSEKVTLRLSIKDIEYGTAPHGGFSIIGGRSPSSDTSLPDPKPTQETPVWKRRIRLHDVQAAVLSDASMFSGLSRSFAPSSSSESTAARSPSGERRKYQTSHNAPADSLLDTDQGATLYSVVDKIPNRSFDNQSSGVSETSYNSSESNPVQHQPTLSYSTSFAPDCASDRSNYNGDILYESTQSDRASSRSEQDSIYDSPNNAGPHLAKPSDNQAQRLRSALKPRRNVTTASERQVREAEDLLGPSSPSSTSSLDEKYIANPSSDDLAESRLFSHEEAESMYMSAMTNLPSTEDNLDRFIPGAWDPHLGLETDNAASATSTRRTKRHPLSEESLELDSAESRRAASESLPSEPPYSDVGGSHTKSVDAAQPGGSPLRSTSKPMKSIPSPPCEPLEAAIEGSLTVSKTFVLVENISISLPLVDADLEPSLEALSPANQGLPMVPSGGEGAQVHMGQRVAFAGAQVPQGQERHDGSEHSSPKISLGTPDVPSNLATSVEVGAVEFRTDICLARLTVLAIRQWNRNIPVRSTVRNKDGDGITGPPSKTKVTVDKIAWKFYDRVVSSPVSGTLQPAPQLGTKSAFMDSELLLKGMVQGLESVVHVSAGSYNSTISMAKVVLGYSNGDILAFDSSLKMRESTRDILAPIERDIVLTITEDARASKIELSTLPINLRLDLRRLDETFAWLGGFSSILDLGNSMISSVTKLDPRIPDHQKSGRPKRGVHFAAPCPGQPTIKEVAQGPSPRKITARVGGLVCTLEGSESSLRLEGTALKVVSRAEGIGMQVDRLHLNGSNLKPKTNQPAIVAQLTNVRMEYLAHPKEVDLARLLGLLSPSKDNYEDDDDILLDNLLYQRSQGGVVRLTAEKSENHLSNVCDLQQFSTILDELKKLGTVTKYLPEDDRPGVLTLVLIRHFRCDAHVGQSFGTINTELKNIEIAHITLPSLFALGISSFHLRRNEEEELLAPALVSDRAEENPSPMMMARFIGNEMEPTVRLKLQQVRVEYHVSFILAIMSIHGNVQSEELLSNVAGSIATLTGGEHGITTGPDSPHEYFKSSANSPPTATAIRIDITIRDSLIGLNPRKSPAKGILVLTKTHFVGTIPKDGEANAVLEVQKATLMIVDKVGNVPPQEKLPKSGPSQQPVSQLHNLESMGYVSISSISAARVALQITQNPGTRSRSIDVEIKDDLFVLETCADSTQTLQAIFNGLAPPLPPSKQMRYRTEVVPIQDMLSSFSGIAFTSDGHRAEDDEEIDCSPKDDEDFDDNEASQDLDLPDSPDTSKSSRLLGGTIDSMLDEDPESVFIERPNVESGGLATSPGLETQSRVLSDGQPLEFQDDHFNATTSVGGTAHRWNTTHNTYGLANDGVIQQSPLRVRVRDVHVIWNLFDGYDWQHTRDTIGKAIGTIETKALDRLSKRDKRKTLDDEDDEESVIGDFLFNSIYIGIPANRDPRNLSRQVQQNLDDDASVTDSSAPSTVASSPSRQGQPSPAKSQRLRLTRSKHHKMTFELKGISADVVVFPPGSGDTQSSVDVRVRDLDVFDHVPTSTWKKFATYMYDAGERESGTSMIHLEILNVRPVPDLVASEIILKATILPLRLHVDQDALDFLTRFFEFKDGSATEPTSKTETAFLQRVEINSVRLKLDFKPKRVDYAGIRSGHTNEFMNFFILDRADMVLRHVIIYGISGFDRLGKTLNDIWMPDIKKNQLPGVLAGLGPVRSLVSVGGGVRDLVVVPIQEYQKDGRIVRSLQKGAMAFAKTTTGELVKLGAKLAIGTQTVLQGTEDFLTQAQQPQFDVAGGWEDAELDEEEKKRISLYADQPVGVIQGLRGAYASLERDLLTAKDAIVAMPGEVMESGTAGGAAKAVLKGAPTIILRPALGVSKAVGRTLLGATNSLDPANRRRIEERGYQERRSDVEMDTPQQSPGSRPNRLPSFIEVLDRKTKPPVDLFSFYIYMRDQQRSVDYLDFWLDVSQHTHLCRHFVSELRRSILVETPDLEKTASKRSSYILDHMGDMNSPSGPSADFNNDEKIKDQNLSAFLRQDNGGSNHSPQSSLGSRQSGMRYGERPPRPSFMSRNSPTGSDSSSPGGRVVARADIRASAEKILYTYILPGAEREVTLPHGILQEITVAIEEEGRDDPEVFDMAKDYTFQAMERDAFPGFLRAKVFGNLVPPSRFLRLVLGLIAFFAGMWAGFVLIFLDKPKHVRCWLILPFTIAVYSLASHQYHMDPLLALAGLSEYTFCNFSRIEEPYVRKMMMRRANMVLFITIAIGVALICLFIFVPGHRL